jgi:hypothetical protein
MAIVKQKSDGKGSLKAIQVLVNKHPNIINQKIKNAFPELADDTICWKSPLENNDFAEYRDHDFIDVLELNREIKNLKNFWPVRGPQWDALAATKNKSVILVEAKANIPEVISPGTGAGVESKKLIVKSLEKAKADLGMINDVDWSGKYYQYTNRLTHLHYLREQGVSAYLINIYFVGDTSVNGPKTIAEWEPALQEMYNYLGIKPHKLNKYMADVFIDIKALK